jgi:hypothetical protein
MPGLGVAGMIHLVLEPTSTVTRACAGQWLVHVACRGTCVGTARMDVYQEGTFLAWD